VISLLFLLLETKKKNQTKRKHTREEEPPPTEDEDSLQPGPILREDYLKQTMTMSGQNKKASLVWDQKNLLMNLGMEDTYLTVGVDMEGSIGG